MTLCDCLQLICIGLCWSTLTIFRLTIYLFFVFFWLVGLSLIIIGIYQLVEYPGKDYDAITEGMNNDMWLAAMCTLLGVGIFMLPVGVVGFYGRFKKHPCMVLVYAVLMCLVLATHIAIVVFLTIHISRVDDYLVDNLENQVKKDYTGEADDPMTEAWDNLQQNVECCGSNGYTDYRDSYYYTTSGNLVPESCCVMDGDHPKNYTACLLDAESWYTDDSLYLHTEGCYSKGSDEINEFAVIIENMLIVLVIIETVCIVAGCCLWFFPEGIDCGKAIDAMEIEETTPQERLARDVGVVARIMSGTLCCYLLSTDEQELDAN